jgi:hypothetical protein
LFLLSFVVAACSSETVKEEVKPECTAGERICSDDMASVKQCREDGTGFDIVEECIQGAMCSEGQCDCPAGMAAGSDACMTVGVEECLAPFVAADGGCGLETPGCGAGEILVVGKCVPVGVEACPEGWLADPENGGCLVDEKPCTEGKDWAIGEGCFESGPVQSCGDPNDDWGVLPDGEGDLVFVNPASQALEEAGTQGKPFKSLAAGVAAAPAGATLVLAKGTYQGGVLLDKGLSIVGKCAEYVTIDGAGTFAGAGGSEGARYALLVVGEGPVTLAGFKIADSGNEPGHRGCGIGADGVSDLEVRDVLVDGLSGAAVELSSVSGAVLHHLAVQEMTMLDELGPFGQIGYGIRIMQSSDVEVTNSRFYKTQGADIHATESCPVVRLNHFERRGGLGGLQPLGVWVQECEGDVLVESNYFLDKMTHAVLIEGGKSIIRRNRVKGTVTDYNDVNGPAIKVSGTEFQIVENHLLENQFAGIAVVGGKGDILANRIEKGLPSDPGLKNGDGLLIKDCDPGPVVVRNNTLVQNTRNGALVTASIARFERNVIAGTLPSPALNVSLGTGVQVVSGSDVGFEGNVISGNYRTGLRFDDAYGWLTGNVVSDTLPDKDELCGGGIVLGGQGGTVLSKGIMDNLITGNFGAGVRADNASLGVVSGNIVQETAGSKTSLGIGMVLNATEADIRGNWVRTNRDTGVLLDGSTGQVEGNLFEDNGLKGKGGGLVAQNNLDTQLLVKGNTFRGNGLAGFVGHQVAVDFRRNHMEDNLPAGGGTGGAGAWIEVASEAEVRANLARANKMSGLLALEAGDVTFAVNYVESTATGAAPGPGEVPFQGADGIAVAAGSFASVLYNTLKNNGTSGIAFFESEGVVQGNVMAFNKGFGLELSGSSITLDVNRYEGNSDGDRQEAGTRIGPGKAAGPWVSCNQEE